MLKVITTVLFLITTSALSAQSENGDIQQLQSEFTSFLQHYNGQDKNKKTSIHLIKRAKISYLKSMIVKSATKQRSLASAKFVK